MSKHIVIFILCAMSAQLAFTQSQADTTQATAVKSDAWLEEAYVVVLTSSAMANAEVDAGVSRFDIPAEMRYDMVFDPRYVSMDTLRGDYGLLVDDGNGNFSPKMKYDTTMVVVVTDLHAVWDLPKSEDPNEIINKYASPVYALHSDAIVKTFTPRGADGQRIVAKADTVSNADTTVTAKADTAMVSTSLVSADTTNGIKADTVSTKWIEPGKVFVFTYADGTEEMYQLDEKTKQFASLNPNSPRLVYMGKNLLGIDKFAVYSKDENGTDTPTMGSIMNMNKFGIGEYAGHNSMSYGNHRNANWWGGSPMGYDWYPQPGFNNGWNRYGGGVYAGFGVSFGFGLGGGSYCGSCFPPPPCNPCGYYSRRATGASVNTAYGIVPIDWGASEVYVDNSSNYYYGGGYNDGGWKSLLGGGNTEPSGVSEEDTFGQLKNGNRPSVTDRRLPIHTTAVREAGAVTAEVPRGTSVNRPEQNRTAVGSVADRTTPVTVQNSEGRKTPQPVMVDRGRTAPTTKLPTRTVPPEGAQSAPGVNGRSSANANATVAQRDQQRGNQQGANTARPAGENRPQARPAQQQTRPQGNQNQQRPSRTVNTGREQRPTVAPRPSPNRGERPAQVNNARPSRGNATQARPTTGRGGNQAMGQRRPATRANNAGTTRGNAQPNVATARQRGR